MLLIVSLVARFRPAAAQVPASAPARPAEPTGTFLRKTLTIEGHEYTHLLFLPAAYDRERTRRWPVLVSLHGSGECGNVDSMLGLALPRYIKEHAKRFPFIVIVPNAPTMWFRGPNAAAVSAAIEATMRDYRADPHRVSLTGYSMGGFGTWEFAFARPDLFAAIVPICGMGAAEFAPNVVHLPIWAFHGENDQNVPVSGSREPIKALRRLGAHPRYTEYAGGNHFIWDRAYATPGLFEWLLKQRVGPAPRRIEYVLRAGATSVWWLSISSEPDLKMPAHMVAEIQEDGHIRVTSEGVREWIIHPDESLLKKGDAVEAIWNGQTVYKGPWSGRLGSTRTTQPATRPVASDSPSIP